MTDKVTVRITFTEKVRYSALVELPRERFDELDTEWSNARGRDLRRVEERISDLCSRSGDWQEAEDIEIEEFEIATDVEIEK